MANDKLDSEYASEYTKEDYLRDEESFKKSEKDGKVDWSAFSRLMRNDLFLNTEILETGCIGDIKLSDIDTAIKHPKKYWRLLLDASSYLMRVSPHYYRLNSLYSNMALFCWWVDLYDVQNTAKTDTIKKQYSKLAAKLEDMNLKHEFAKIMRYLPYQDIYCGLVVESSTDFFFLKIDYRICQLYQVQDGLYNFKIDLGKIKQSELAAYPDYVQQAYLDYIDGKASFGISRQQISRFALSLIVNGHIHIQCS